MAGRSALVEFRVDQLFTEHHCDAFRELLTAAELRTNDSGQPRNMRCIRPTSISHWLLDRPTVPLTFTGGEWERPYAAQLLQPESVVTKLPELTESGRWETKRNGRGR